MLELEGLSKTYANGHRALDGVSATIGEGVLGLLGPNGAGKSTLMSILATVTRPSAGTFRWRGVDGVRQPLAVRRDLGYLPQDFGVYGRLTAREFLAYFGRLKGLSGPSLAGRVEELLELVNLHGVADRRLAGYSGGMRQRVGIAQALLGDARLVIVDEPTVGLDPEERLRLRNLLSEIAHGRVVILSTHIVSDVEAVATRIAVLSDGRLLAEEAPEDLVRRAAGRVFTRLLPSAELPAFQARPGIQVSALVRRAEGVQVRFVDLGGGGGGAHPTGDAVEPTIEDAYILLRRDGRAR